MNHQPTAAVGVFFILAGSALAQCPPERLEPHEFGGDFGFALAMNERHLIIGDRHDWSMCTSRCSNGMAYAYRRDAQGGWVFDQFITPVDLAPGYSFGSAVALDGDRAIISAVLSPACGGTGVPYVFEFDGERWIEAGRLCPPDGRPFHGSRVALFDGTALTSTASGSALIYQRVGRDWHIAHDLRNPDTTGVRTGFGAAMTMNQDWVAIGAPIEPTVAPNGGAVYVYSRGDEGALELAQKLIAPDVEEGPRFGTSMAIDGGVLAIGAMNADRRYAFQGVVYLYELVGDRWELKQEVTPAEPLGRDGFGLTLAMHGNVMAVGASQLGAPLTGGGAYAFERNPAGVWRQAAKLLPDRPVEAFGNAIAVANGMVAVGADDTRIEGEDRGVVELFDLACYLCPADLDLDGSLTIYDFLTFLNLFQDGDPLADFDGDGELTIFDFLAFQTAFDAGCE